MTGWMFAALGRLKAPWWASLALAVVALFLLPVAFLVDATVLFVRVVRVGAYLERTEMVCPRGHVVRVREDTALWTCGSCGYGYLGSGFAPCPRCRAIPAFIQCFCGSSVRNPVWDEIGDHDA